jgi:mannosyltransferase
MEQHNKTYGFVIAIKELVETVPNLFRYASAYKRQNNFKSKGLWEMFLKEQPKEEKPKPVESPQSLPDEVLQMDPVEKEELPEVDPEGMEGESYNMCHFWSNFEIARLDFFRSKEYEDFFNMMDRSGGFWAERVHSPLSYQTNP